MATPNRKEKETSRGFLWALGGVALAGAGVAALLYFTNEKDDDSGPKVTLVEDRLREQVREIFRTRNVSEENCNICLERLKNVGGPNQHGMMLTCGHVYHQGCIEGWFRTQKRDGHTPNCPACRAPS